MKNWLLLFIAFLAMSFLGNAQVISNFNNPVKGITGFEKSSDSGPGLDSLYWTHDPSNSSNGVMAMAIHWDSAGWHGRMELGDGGNATYTPGGTAQYMTFWIYIDSAQNVPDSMTIDAYAMDNTNWSWTEPGYGAKKLAIKDIPHNRWYPLAFPLAASKANNPNFQYNAAGAGKGFMTGLQFWPSTASVGWKGVIYIDNVALVGALPHTIAGPGAKGFEKSSDSGPGLDSVYSAPDPDPLDASGDVMAMAIHWDSASWHGRMDLGDGSGNATYVPGGAAQFVTFWVYIDSSQNVPDSMTIDSYAMDNTNWSWTEPGYGAQKLAMKDIPHNRWYPMAFPLAASKANNPNFQYNATGAGKGFMTGLQFWPDSASVGWHGIIYVKGVALLDTVTAFKPSVWTAANFESKGSNGKQGFYVPSYASGTIKRYADLQTSNASYVLQAALNMSPSAPKFAVVRDTVPMMDAVSDSGAISISFELYLPGNFPNNALVQFFVSGNSKDSVSVIDTVGQGVKHGQWNILTIDGLNTLAAAGKFDPSIPARVGVIIWYPAPYDTMKFSGNIEFDNLQITGFSNPRQLVDGIKIYSGGIKTYKLYNNYPNPFNPSTMIQYDLPRTSKVVLKVYNILGKEITTLVNRSQSAGTYKVSLNMAGYASGVYFVRIIADSYQHVQKIMLLKLSILLKIKRRDLYDPVAF